MAEANSLAGESTTLTRGSREQCPTKYGIVRLNLIVWQLPKGSSAFPSARTSPTLDTGIVFAHLNPQL